MDRNQDGSTITATDTLESLWEQFERTGSIETFLKFRQLSARVLSSEESPLS